MPYDYRGMTPEQRQEIIRQRWGRGYPLHAPPHPFRDAGYYLLSAANFEHAEIMASPHRRTDFEGRLIEAMQGAGADLFGWVILPNHYHMLVGVSSLDLVSGALQRLHGTTSREWNLTDQKTGKRRVWYTFTDRKVRGDVHFYQALNYVHVNPLKHGYVEDPYEWPWSSLRSYLEAYGREWLREKWRAYPPVDIGQGFDDWQRHRL